METTFAATRLGSMLPPDVRHLIFENVYKHQMSLVFEELERVSTCYMYQDSRRRRASSKLVVPYLTPETCFCFCCVRLMSLSIKTRLGGLLDATGLLEARRVIARPATGYC